MHAAQGPEQDQEKQPCSWHPEIPLRPPWPGPVHRGPAGPRLTPPRRGLVRLLLNRISLTFLGAPTGPGTPLPRDCHRVLGEHPLCARHGASEQNRLPRHAGGTVRTERERSRFYFRVARPLASEGARTEPSGLHATRADACPSTVCTLASHLAAGGAGRRGPDGDRARKRRGRRGQTGSVPCPPSCSPWG